MILDQWSNRKYYKNTHPLFSECFSYIEKYLENPVFPGVYEISGKDIFAKVQSYQTRTDGFYETHDCYIDIQFMVSGIEMVHCIPREGLAPVGEYDPVEDAQFYADTKPGVSFLLCPESFAIFFPEDAHKPAMALDEPAEAKKVVIKVRV